MVKSELTAHLRPFIPVATLGGAAYPKRKKEPRECFMMFWQGVLVVLLTYATYTLSLKPGIVVKPLPQGLFIQQKGGLYYQTAEWVALTTISSPPPREKLLDMATKLDKESKTIRQRLPQFTENWLTRLQWCREYLQQFQPNRQKRAPPWFYRSPFTHTVWDCYRRRTFSI